MNNFALFLLALFGLSLAACKPSSKSGAEKADEALGGDDASDDGADGQHQPDGADDGPPNAPASRLGVFSNLSRVLSDGSLAPVVGESGLSLEDAVALAITDQSGLSLTDTDDGSVSRIMVADAKVVYVLFTEKVKLLPESDTQCLLARVEADGAVACVDSDLESIEWRVADDAVRNPPIQFDDDGGIYYLGRAASKTVLRRSSASGQTDLINDNTSISDFLVNPQDKSALLLGASSTGVKWLRSISGSGALSTVYTASSDEPRFVAEFPDGKIYVGIPDAYSVFRMDRGATSFEAERWIGDSLLGHVDHHFDFQDVCDGNGGNTASPLNGFCQGYGGAGVSAFSRTGGKVYAQVGTSFMEYYPQVRLPATPLARVIHVKGAGDHMFLAGLDGAGVNKLVRFDTDTEAATDVIPDQEIEIYHLDYSGAEGSKVLFDGLRFSDNKYVIGQVDPVTLEVHYVETNQKLVLLQSL